MSFSPRKRFCVVLALAGLLAVGLGIALRAPTPSSVKLQFLGPTWVDLVGERWESEITNGSSRAIWWNIQYGETNSYGRLRISQYGTENGEPPMAPHTSWKSHSRQLKSGTKVWFVWTDQPFQPLIPRSAFRSWRIRFSAFASRHGWKRAAEYVQPKPAERHVIELTVR
jgi:hypothetical protein